MRDVFKGWRRKVGCVTLLLALAIAGLYIRSRVVEDILVYRQDAIIGLSTGPHGLSWSRYTPWIPDSGSPASWDYAQDLVSSASKRDRYDGYLVVWRWQWEGFDFGERQEEHYTKQLIDWTIPHWSVFIPLTLLSAYLILWKPRQRTGSDHA